uniref:Uncharacterized protein n=1 Tax=Ackermannviridae sp. TaxID=2831612 RepID=A0A8S5RV41_9CAUD|nr:MAG TPA: hypothetical protein [Ackermannviridae sp.]
MGIAVRVSEPPPTMGLGLSVSRPSSHNIKRSATAGRFFICCIADYFGDVTKMV